MEPIETSMNQSLRRVPKLQSPHPNTNSSRQEPVLPPMRSSAIARNGRVQRGRAGTSGGTGEAAPATDGSSSGGAAFGFLKTMMTGRGSILRTRLARSSRRPMYGAVGAEDEQEVNETIAAGMVSQHDSLDPETGLASQLPHPPFGIGGRVDRRMSSPSLDTVLRSNSFHRRRISRDDRTGRLTPFPVEIDDHGDAVVRGSEANLRLLLVVLASFSAGASYPSFSPIVFRIAEVVAIAWGTCVIIILLTMWRKRNVPRNVNSIPSDDAPRAPLLRGDIEQGPVPPKDDSVTPVRGHSSYVQPPLSVVGNSDFKPVDHETITDNGGTQTETTDDEPLPDFGEERIPAEEEVDSDCDDTGDRKSNEPTKCNDGILDEQKKSSQAHPELEDLHIFDALTQQRVPPNGKPYHIDNDLFSGVFLMMIRTSDADKPVEDPALRGTESNDAVSAYLRGKQRRFEFQYQVRLKRKPEGPLYLGCEVVEPIKLGAIQKVFIGATMNFVRKMNSGFHYCLAGSDPTSDDPAVKEGRYERPHVAFTVDNSMDRLVATRPGEEVPKLGAEIHEDPESIKQRRKGGKVDWNTEDTYTMALYSSYADFLKWKCMNFPGVRPFSMATIVGPQPIHLTVYMLQTDSNSSSTQSQTDLSSPRHNAAHNRCDVKVFTDLEISHRSLTGLGPIALGALASEGTTTLPVKGAKSSVPVQSEGGGGLDDDAANYSELDISEKDADVDADGNGSRDVEDEAVLAELGEGIYLRSGDRVFLREASPLAAEQPSTQSFVSIGGGFAVVRQQTGSVVVIQSVVQNSHDENDSDAQVATPQKSNIIRNGDTVLIKLLSPRKLGTNDGHETKYLSLHRGWWLKWVSQIPRQNGFFKIFAHGDVAVAETRAERQPSYLRLGDSFSLRHKRWSRFDVGVRVDRSATFGGRMLGLFKDGADDPSDDAHMPSADPYLGDGTPLSVSKRGRKYWMRLLTLCADAAETDFSQRDSYGKEINSQPQQEEAVHVEASKSVLGKLHERISGMDAPAWIEMMHRTKRQRQRVYVVRIRKERISSKLEENPNSSQLTHLEGTRDERATEMFTTAEAPFGDNATTSNEWDHMLSRTSMRLKTGHHLSPVIRLGLSWGLSSARGSLGVENQGGEEDAPPVSEVTVEHAEDDNDVVAGDTNVAGAPRDPRHNESPHSTNAADHLPSDMGPTETDAEGEQFLAEHDEVRGNKSLDDSWHSDRDAIAVGTRRFRRSMSLSSAVEAAVEAPSIEAAHSVSSEDLVGCSDLERGEDIDENSLQGEANLDDVEAPESPLEYRRKSWMVKPASGIGLVAKKVKTGTAMTGKQVVKHSKIIGKGTVIAGRAIIKKRNPVREPRGLLSPQAKKSASNRRQGRDHHVAVNRALKSARKSHGVELSSGLQAADYVAGQMTAPDQSCRSVSHVLHEMSSMDLWAYNSSKERDEVLAQVDSFTELDQWFLRGGPTELGVVPLKSGEQALHEAIVARCLWESHWREECCILLPNRLDLYAPLASKPCFSVSLLDVQSVRRLDADDNDCPLPGAPILVLETAWRCHYFAFADARTRESFMASLQSAVFECGDAESVLERDVWKAHLWQGFQTSVVSSPVAPRGKWAPVSSAKKSKPRVVLNGRRMSFDVDSFQGLSDTKDTIESSVGAFIEDLLTQALSFSLESLESSPSNFMRFLDGTSRLRKLPLNSLDMSGPQAFCIFLNTYHCLLQHALLLTVSGPLNKKSVGHFMRCTCYEIGGDVFSLSELQAKVIRGRMSSPTHPKSPFLEPSRSSRAHSFYSLDFRDPRVNFVFNNGDVSYPPAVPVLRPDILEDQLMSVTTAFLQKNVSVDPGRRTVMLPKVFDVYRPDFLQDVHGQTGDTGIHLLLFCMPYLDDATKAKVREMMTNSGSESEEGPPPSPSFSPVSLSGPKTGSTSSSSPSTAVNSIHIRYRVGADKFHSRLILLSS